MSPVPSALRGRRRLALLVVAMLAALTLGANPAIAAPPRCPDGSPPPCDGEDPPDPPETTPTTRRTTTTTTPTPTSIAIPTTTTPTTPPTTVPPATRKVSVLMLVQDDGGLTGPVNAERYWKYEPVSTQDLSLLPGPGDTVLGMTPAGTSGLENNELTFPDYALPAGQEMVMRVTEGGSPGALCRTVPRSVLPPSGALLHILVAPPLTLGADELTDMAGGFVGPIAAADLPANVTMAITAATLAPQSDSLALNLQGTLRVGAFNYTFDYDLPLRLVPSTSTKLASVLHVQAAGAGTVELTSVGQPNGDGLIELIKAELLPKLRSAVPVKGTPAVNAEVHGNHDVQWWADQDFHISMRRVAYATTGITLYPSLCRLG